MTGRGQWPCEWRAGCTRDIQGKGWGKLQPDYLEKEQSPSSAARGHEALRLSQFINCSSVHSSFTWSHLQDKELELLFVEGVSDNTPGATHFPRRA